MISVIVPMYNAESTVKKCLGSLIESSAGIEHEIIAVDDGSVDATAEIVENIVSDVPSLRLYRQSNRGVSVARNFGVEQAHGEIIAFVDSDDYVKKQYFSMIESVFRNTDADVVFFAFERVNEKGELISVHSLPTPTGDFCKDIISLSTNDTFGYTWVKAFRKDIIGEVRFNEDISIFEDEMFTCDVMLKHPKLAFVNEPVYCYVRGANSLSLRTHQYYSKACNSVFVKWRELVNDSYDGCEFIKDKAEHFAQNCKWYAVEKKVDSLRFLRDISESEYIKYLPNTDRFLRAVRERKLLYALMSINIHRAKAIIWHLLGR